MVAVVAIPSFARHVSRTFQRENIMRTFAAGVKPQSALAMEGFIVVAFDVARLTSRLL
jgi:hypothetical protein